MDYTKSPKLKEVTLPRRHVVLLTLERLRQGTKQPTLAAHYGVDQSMISKYLDYTISTMREFLPTATNISKSLRTCTIQELERMVPGLEIIIDGTHVPIDRPAGKKTKKANHSKKMKKFTINTTMVTNRKGLIIGMGRSAAGATHDLTMLRDDELDLGPITKLAKDPKTPKEQMVTIRVDPGYQGIAKDLPGAIIKMNQRSENHELVEKENEHLNKERVTVEHGIGMVKQYGLMTGPYENSDGQFHKELDVITGLVNAHLMGLQEEMLQA